MIRVDLPSDQGADNDIPLIKDADINSIVGKAIASNHGVPKKWLMTSAEQAAAMRNGTLNNPENNRIVAPPRSSRTLSGGLPPPRPPMVRPSQPVPPLNPSQLQYQPVEENHPNGGPVYYEDGNTMFKEDNGILYRKGWCDCQDMENYRLLNKNRVELSLKGKILQVYDWIPMKKHVLSPPPVIHPETTVGTQYQESTSVHVISGDTNSPHENDLVLRTNQGSELPHVEQGTPVPLAADGGDSAKNAKTEEDVRPLSGGTGK
jgi:hypothetical protein